ncbi:MAG: cysteine desulfurase [Thermoplasmata archaeon]|nr:cysteine desulfurase [Thermoplasmata archaeon]
MRKDVIYLDNGNVSPVADEVFEAMKEYYLHSFGVPGGEFGHLLEEEASEALIKAREVIAGSIGARPEEIIFTSGVTESDNMAVKGAAFASEKKGAIVTSPIERKCVLITSEYLRKFGFEVRRLPVNRVGKVLPGTVERFLEDAILLSVQHANQEIGTVQDIKALGEIAHDKGVLFHTDATHSYMRERIDVRKLDVDLLTISAHVIHGPLGAGALYVREGVKIDPLLHGDSREFGLRAGHPDLPAIVGFAEAVKLYRDEHVEYMRGLQRKLMSELLQIEESRMNGPQPGPERVADNVNISFRGVEGEAVLMMASQRGVILRTGSACFDPSLQASYVIKALGVGVEYANGSVRMTLSRYNTPDEVERASEILREVIEKLRSISPLARKFRGKKISDVC